MKKILILILLMAMTQNLCTFAVTDSTNEFPIELTSDDIPDGNSDSDGLSGGAVTAITLGSIGLLALGGLGYWIYKKYYAQGICAGNAIGCDCPIMAICFDENAKCEMIAKYPENTLLNKALKQTKITQCPCNKYILIPDTTIEYNTFNTIGFEVPKNMKNFRMIMARSNAKIEPEIFAQTEKQENIRLQNVIDNKENGILVKKGEISDTDKGVLTLSLKGQNTNQEKYAIIIEFFE
ncbi:MAG: hypothetical protein R3Y28_00690 [Candidatus Gastranaerophilales bacterium]